MQPGKIQLVGVIFSLAMIFLLFIPLLLTRKPKKLEDALKKTDKLPDDWFGNE
jgi:hypothetical protein